MNLRTVGIVLVGILLLTGVGTFVLGGAGDAPFEQNNTTLPTEPEPVNSSQGVDNKTLTEQAVTLNTLRLSQETFRLEVTTEEQGEVITEGILYTPTTTYKSITESDRIIYEYYYTPEYTAIRERVTENGSTYALRDPQTRVSDHVKQENLDALVTSINFTASQTETRNGTEYTTYTGETLTGDGNRLASSFGVDSIIRIQEATITRDETNGIITDVNFEAVVQNNDARYTLARAYNLTINDNIVVSAPSWVQTANERNAGIEAYIISDSEMRLQHKYGATLYSGDEIQIQKPGGAEYIVTVPQETAFEPGDTAVITQQNGTLELIVNPTSDIEGEPFAQEAGEYTIIFTTDTGVVAIDTATA